MMDINFSKLRSPQVIFLLYVLISGALIMAFRFVFPGSEPPLLFFYRDWRLICGALELFRLFPALAFSALIIPFGMVSSSDNFIDDDQSGFSAIFFKRLLPSVIIAICAAVVYCGIFFLALPLVKNSEENLLFRGELYNLARERAQQNADAGEWDESLQFYHICDSIWPDNPALDDLKNKIEINLDKSQSEINEEKSHSRTALARNWRSLDSSMTSEENAELNAAQAIDMAYTAFEEKRYFDAHWLASLGGRIAVRGSPEEASAARLASNAWNQIQAQTPNKREQRLYSLYELKLSGYQAMNSGEWIQAYYIFKELMALSPDDPDAVNFFAVSEQETKGYAFFIDEMELSMGEILTGALFSFPGRNGRVVMRFSSLSAAQDFAYGRSLEYMEFDNGSRLTANVRTPFVKLLPVTIGGKSQVLVLMHALDRDDKNISWQSEWITGEKGQTLILDIDFNVLLLLTQVRRGLGNLQLDELYAASGQLGSAGYITEIFEAEILNRLGSAVFFLPMAILVIVIGWRYRAKTRPRYLFVLLLPVMPVVFNALVSLYQYILNMFGIWLILIFGFSAAFTVFVIVLALCLFISLIALAAQHG